jgi:membrane associated rhomboid family serine protease
VAIPHAPGPVPIYLTILSAMFMHGGIGHILGNLLYLWIFGDNVEHRFGHGVFLAFYLVSGVAATFAQVALDPGSVIPNLGASGAISGVLGAYLVLFPKNRVHAVFFFRVIAIPAALALGLWIFLQFVNGFGAIAATEQTGGVAYGAHIGGFAAGVLLAFVLRTVIPAERPNVLQAAMRRDPRARPLW